MAEQRKDVVVVAPPRSSLAVALVAALRAHGWRPTLQVASADHHSSGLATLFVAEDDDGHPATHRPTQDASGTLVCVGSVRSVAVLIPLAMRGARVLNQSMPFAPLLRHVENALRAGRGEPGGASVAVLRRREAELAALARLTIAEGEALHGLQGGLSAAQIAGRSHRSLHTVRSHIKAVLWKLGVRSQVAAVAMANRCAVAHDDDRLGLRITTFGDEGDEPLTSW